MGEAGRDHHTPDDLFQILCVRKIPPVQARREILQACQNEELKIDFHIRGGARKTRPMREATPEELRRFEALGAALRERKASHEEMREEMDRAEAFLYEHAPPEGITDRVHYQSWERLFTLSIRGGHLVVEPIAALDYPWDAYSFTIANWSVINEKWPPRVMTFVPPAVLIEPASPIANVPTAPVEETPASKTDPSTKMSRLEWTKEHLTKNRKGELSKKYDEVSKATAEVFDVMKADPRVKPYKNPRTFERHLAEFFPTKRRKPRK